MVAAEGGAALSLIIKHRTHYGQKKNQTATAIIQNLGSARQ